MKKQINYWKILTIIFGILILFYIMIISTPIILSEEIYTFGTFSIPKNSFEALVSTISENKFSICDLKEKECVVLNRLK